MKGYVFDRTLLARREADRNLDPYQAAGEVLRAYLGGGDVFAEVRERARRDPRLRAMSEVASRMLAPAVDQAPRNGRRRARRPRGLP